MTGIIIYHIIGSAITATETEDTIEGIRGVKTRSIAYKLLFEFAKELKK